MSEIISSVYELMENTGIQNGILFLDEINCVSETLYPSMLQFLQFKTFALRSYDKRLKKILGRMAEGDALGQSYSIFLSTALGTVGALTNTLINTAGMTEEQRKEYLKKTLKYDPEEGLTLDTVFQAGINGCLLYTTPSPRDAHESRMPSSA